MINITELEAKYQELGKEIEKLKANECEYPKFFRNTLHNFIVKFTTLTDGVVVYDDIIANIGDSRGKYVPHTNKSLWEEIPHDKTTGLYHKQLVWCWDGLWTHLKQLRFYDVRNSCSFCSDGTGDVAEFDNYEPYDWSCNFINEWAVEAVKTLDDKQRNN